MQSARGAHGQGSGAAFEDFGHVPDNGRIVTLEQRQCRENRGVAAAAGDDHLRTRRQRLLDRFHPHHADDVGRRVDIGFAQRRRGRQGSCAAVAEMPADDVPRQFRMNDGEFEMEVLLAGDLTHDVDHPGEPGIGSRRARRADDQRDTDSGGAGHHDLGVALDRSCGEHAAPGGKSAGARISAAGIAADHPRTERNCLVQ
jgi:hypothetical protein